MAIQFRFASMIGEVDQPWPPESRALPVSMHFDPTNDADFAPLKAEWSLRPGMIYLNHGSFGPPPRPVREARQHWQDALDSQPPSF